MNTEMIWQVKPKIDRSIIDQFPEINPVILQLLFNRKIDTQHQIDEFLYPDYSENTHDPFLFNDMEKATTRILEAVAHQENIVVYGDYDADGVTSSAIMVELLKSLGAKVDIYIPYRETEGYGLNQEAALELIKNGTQLVITVDCGISNKEEIKTLTQGGVDVIVTDHHHEPMELPQALAILNPHLASEKYPFKDLTGCGVAYKVAQGVIKRHHQYPVNQLPEGWEKWLLDLVAIGTIADLQPLLGENRTLVKYGLIVLQKTKRLGLLKLIEKLNGNITQIDEKVVGWQICPRLNAAGRLNHASSAYELLITEDSQTAERLALELSQTNQQRQQITEKIYNDAKKMLGEVSDRSILIAIGQDWPTGIVGLVAGRLTDEFHRPSLVISHYKGEIIGSGRSIPEFNIIEAVEKCHDYLTRYGGHTQACGFTVKAEGLEPFVEKITKLAETELAGKDIMPALTVDLEVNLEEINWALFENLAKFSPFGEGNPKPLFVARNLTIAEMQNLGQDGKHLRLMVRHQTPVIRKTIGFCFGGWCAKLKIGDKIDLLFEVDVNEWNGNRELQLKIVDLKPSV